MATKEYQLTVATNDATETACPQSGDLTNYRTQVIVKTHKSCQAKIQYSSVGGSNAGDWDDYIAAGETSPWFAVNATSLSKLVRLAKYVRVAAQNLVAGETDTVDITLRAESDTPTYCTAEDVARMLNIRTADGARFEFTDNTTPSLAEVNDSILEMEDYIDQITGNAWRAVLVSNETYKFSWDRYLRLDTYRVDERFIVLKHRNIRPLVAGTHHINVFNGGTYDDLAGGSYTEARNGDWWMDYVKGIVYFTGHYPTRVTNAVTMTYEYGESTVPHDIRRACAYLVAGDIALTDDAASVFPEGGDKTVGSLKSDKFTEKAMRLLGPRTRLRVA